MDDEQRAALDPALTVVPQVGLLIDTGEDGEPFRLRDPHGAPVEAVAAYFRELQASGRSTATIRSYGMDLLRWFRFCWAVGVAWDRASRVEAREFSRWLRMPGQPVRAHWRAPQTPTLAAARGSAPSASRTIHPAALILAGRGGGLDTITAGDVLDLLDDETAGYGKSIGDGALLYRMLHAMGCFGEHAPPTLRQLRTGRQLSPDEAHRPIPAALPPGP